MLWRFKKSLVKDLEPSNWAAAALGPKILSLASLKASTMPATNGASGPTMVRSMAAFCAKFTKPGMSITSISTFSIFGSCLVPGLPGATRVHHYQQLKLSSALSDGSGYSTALKLKLS